MPEAATNVAKSPTWVKNLKKQADPFKIKQKSSGLGVVKGGEKSGQVLPAVTIEPGVKDFLKKY